MGEKIGWSSNKFGNKGGLNEVKQVSFQQDFAELLICEGGSPREGGVYKMHCFPNSLITELFLFQRLFHGLNVLQKSQQMLPLVAAEFAYFSHISHLLQPCIFFTGCLLPAFICLPFSLVPFQTLLSCPLFPTLLLFTLLTHFLLAFSGFSRSC